MARAKRPTRLLKDGPILDAYDHHFTTRTIKVVFDGSLGSRSAALLKPYADADTSGFLTEKEDDLRPMFREALRRGIQVETHAIGDRANRTILDLYEEAFKAVPPDERKVKEPRWRVEHAQILSPVRHSALRKVGRDRLDAAIARDQRSFLRAAPARGEAAGRRLCLAEFAQERRDHRCRLRCAGRARVSR